MSIKRISEKVGASLFKSAVRLRQTLYDRGTLRTVKVPDISVVSVGNLAMGGCGKTPFAAYLASHYQHQNQQVAIVLRGYGGRLSKKGVQASNGAGPLFGPADIGDEAYMLATQLEGVHVWVGADRAAQVARARDNGASLAVLDDGFQHQHLHRDANILLASPAHLMPNAPLFPVGELREPADGANRADLIGGWTAKWREPMGFAPDFTFDWVPSGLSTGGGERLDLEMLSGKRVVLLAAIAHPMRIVDTVRSLNGIVVATHFYRDHHCFSNDEIKEAIRERSQRQADWVLTTQKDMARMATCPAMKRDDIAALHGKIKVVMGTEMLERTVAQKCFCSES